MDGDPITSAATLRHRQYATPGNLAARQVLWAYRAEPEAHQRARLDTLELTGAERVLDVGCGDGRYLAALRGRGHTGPLLGLDLSEGMARAAGPASGAPVAVADAARLPVVTGGVDAALALHMLYHLPDVTAAIAELRRVIRPGGTLVASTNGGRHIAEILAIIDDSVQVVTGRPRAERRFSFTLETGAALLEASFSEIVAHGEVELVPVPEPEPVVAYIASLGPEHVGVAPGQWKAFLAAATFRVHAAMDRDGDFLVTSHSGHFRAR